MRDEIVTLPTIVLPHTRQRTVVSHLTCNDACRYCVVGHVGNRLPQIWLGVV